MQQIEAAAGCPSIRTQYVTAVCNSRIHIMFRTLGIFTWQSEDVFVFTLRNKIAGADLWVYP